MTHKKLSARILSLVLTAAMVGTMMPQAVFAAEGDAALGTSGIEKTTRTITAFDELGEGYTKSVPFDGHTYAVTVKLGTPIEEIVLPTKLGVTVEKTTTTTTPPAKDEVQDDVVDSGEAPKDTAPADEPTAEPEDKTVAETPAADEPASTVPAAQVADTDTTVSGNEPATPSDAEPAPAPEEKPDAEAPPADEPEQDEPEQDKETTVTETTQETISVTWKGDREYTPDQNSKVIYTAVLPEGYALADGTKLPTIYVMVGKQARAATVIQRTTPLDLATNANITYIGDDGITSKTANPTTSDIIDTGEGWSWNFSTKTLTLNGANINLGDDAQVSGLIKAIVLPSGTVTVVIQGQNSLRLETKSPAYVKFGMIGGSSDLTIRGTGSLAIFVPDPMNRGCNGINVKSVKIEEFPNIAITGAPLYGINTTSDIRMTGGTISAMGLTNAFVSWSGKIIATDATVSGAKEPFVSGETSTLTQSDQATPVVFSVVSSSPSITVDTQIGAATYGTAANPTFTVTNSSFSGEVPTFNPSVTWVGTAPTGVTAAFTDSDAKLTLNTTTATPAGEYKFKVVSPKTGGGNYESAEATLKVDKLTASITWGSTISFTYNGSEQAPTATVRNAVNGDVLTVTVTGGQTNAGTSYTATADALTGTAASNYALPTTGNTQAFTITAKTVTVTDGTLEVKKAYDGKTDAGTATGKLGLTGVVGSDDVSVKVVTVGTYAGANVGKNKTVTLNISLEGSAKDNYTLGSVTTYSFDKAEITKAAYSGTAASAPDSTPASKGDKSITIKPVTSPIDEDVEYAVSTINTPPTSDSDWQTSTTFDNLDPNTKYYFFARVKENNNHAPGGVSSGTSITTDKSEYTTKPTKPDGTPDSKSDTSITLKTVTPPGGETLEYGIDKDNNGTITWQSSPTFSSLSPNTEYKFYTRVKENDKHKAGPESDATPIKTDLNDAQKVAAAKIAVTNALNTFTATNATDADTIMALVNKALSDAGITDVIPSWDASGDFSKTESTEDNDGSVTGKIKLTCNSASDTVDLNKTIAPLPSDPAEKVRLVKAAIEAALNAYTATNATTAADIKTIVDKATVDSGVTGVTVAWNTPSDFNNKNSSNSENGKVTGTFDLSCTKGGNTATDTVSFNCPIERSNLQKLNGAITDANNAKYGISVNNNAPSSVANGTKFVSDAEMKALTDAIVAAQSVADKENATTAEVIAATNALNTAVDTYKKAIKTGTYTSGSDSSSSSGGGGSSSGGSTPPPVVVPPTTTQPNPPTTVETKVPATVDNKGNATVNVTDKTMQDAIDKAVAEAKKNGASGNGISVVISVTTGGKDANTVTVNLPKTVQDQVIAGKVLNTVVVVDRPDISINMNLATIKEINKQAKSDVQLSAIRMENRKLSGDAKKAIGNRPTFDLKATYASGSKAISNFGNGNVTVGIPYTLQAGEVASGLYAVYVDGNGKVTYLTNSSYDANAKLLRFSTNHFSVYGIGYKAPIGFTDIANHWAKSDIEFVVNRGLFSGTSATTFSPDGAMTRGMFVTALGRLAGIDVNAYKTNKFTDVKADAYYAPYANWAASKGITNGTTATTFAPDTAISRQEMAVMMSNYAKALGYTVPKTRAANTFADNANIANWAAAAVKQMQMAGILNGKNSNKFDPTGIATRGEISAMLRRYVELTIDRATTEGWTINDSSSGMYYQKGKALTGSHLIGTTTYVFNNYGETTRKTNIAGATTIAVAL